MKLYNEELHNLYFSPNIISVIKSRRMRWVGTCSIHSTDEKFRQFLNITHMRFVPEMNKYQGQ
jgi:hypothetical protein